MLIIRPKSRFPSTRFLFYLLKSDSFQRYILEQQSGTTFYGLSQESVANFDAELPESLEDQLSIADFLDGATQEIDALIEKKKRLIGLLDEERQAPISHAVTRSRWFNNASDSRPPRQVYPPAAWIRHHGSGVR